MIQGQPKFRNMWDRYARGADAIVYVVDAAEVSRNVMRHPRHQAPLDFRLGLL